MNKIETIAKLKELGIEFDETATKAELSALLPEIEDEVETEEESSKTEATVVYAGGTRTYTKEIHGKDFEKLAKQFAGKFNGEVK